MRKKSKSPPDPRQLCLIDWIEEQIRKEQVAKAKPAFSTCVDHRGFKCEAELFIRNPLKQMGGN